MIGAIARRQPKPLPSSPSSLSVCKGVSTPIEARRDSARVVASSVRPAVTALAVPSKPAWISTMLAKAAMTKATMTSSKVKPASRGIDAHLARQPVGGDRGPACTGVEHHAAAGGAAVGVEDDAAGAGFKRDVDPIGKSWQR